MKTYLKLFRVNHYIKNLLIFTTLIFGSKMFTNSFYPTLIGFIAFNLMSSVIYIINDIFDYEVDKKTESKKNGPIASGKISIQKAIKIATILFIFSIIINFFTGNLKSYIFLLLYFILNLFYSSIGKKIPYLELILMISFYLIRIYYGASILSVSVSIPLNLTVIFGSLYLTLMKRRLELTKKKYRKVFNIYIEKNLQIASIISFMLMILSYLLWTYHERIKYLYLTTILIVMIFMRYHRKIKLSENGNLVEVILNDYLLIFLCSSYIILMIFLIEVII